MPSGKRHEPFSPVLLLSDEEAATRRAAKAGIAARYGFSDWNSAPAAALREYGNFLKARTGAQQ